MSVDRNHLALLSVVYKLQTSKVAKDKETVESDNLGSYNLNSEFSIKAQFFHY